MLRQLPPLGAQVRPDQAHDLAIPGGRPRAGRPFVQLGRRAPPGSGPGRAAAARPPSAAARAATSSPRPRRRAASRKVSSVASARSVSSCTPPAAARDRGAAGQPRDRARRGAPPDRAPVRAGAPAQSRPPHCAAPRRPRGATHARRAADRPPASGDHPDDRAGKPARQRPARSRPADRSRAAPAWVPLGEVSSESACSASRLSASIPRTRSYAAPRAGSGTRLDRCARGAGSSPAALAGSRSTPVRRRYTSPASLQARVPEQLGQGASARGCSGCFRRIASSSARAPARSPSVPASRSARARRSDVTSNGLAAAAMRAASAAESAGASAGWVSSGAAARTRPREPDRSPAPRAAARSPARARADWPPRASAADSSNARTRCAGTSRQAASVSEAPLVAALSPVRAAAIRSARAAGRKRRLCGERRAPALRGGGGIARGLLEPRPLRRAQPRRSDDPTPRRRGGRWPPSTHAPGPPSRRPRRRPAPGSGQRALVVAKTGASAGLWAGRPQPGRALGDRGRDSPLRAAGVGPPRVAEQPTVR